MAGVLCHNGPCKPWTQTGCRSCGVRPMKVYQGNSGSKEVVAWCHENGYGILISPGYWKTPTRYPYYCLDNGAFPAWINNRTWEAEPFLIHLEKAIASEISPDFAVCPDKVAAGEESLRFSLDWMDKLPSGPRYYLAVQDGMHPADVECALQKFAGLFVGGTMDWKLNTAPIWVDLAHRHNKPCHIGRVGPWFNILWAVNIGADSIDSTTWTRYTDRRYHLAYAKMQQMLEVA